MDLDNNILQVVEPSIRPTEVKFGTADEDKGADKRTKSVGVDQPYVIINGYEFKGSDIVYCKLSVNGFYPKLTLSLTDSRMAFDVGTYPRDGDNITLLINSKNQDTFKSIHMDFDITSVSSPSTPSGFAGDTARDYNFQGVCKIPGLFAEDCKSYGEGTSLEHIEKVATELKLGLATNIDATDDLQNRIQPYSTKFDFIKDVVNYSYVGEECFQTFYIDQYYNLNFVELNKVFNSKRLSGDDMQNSITSYANSIEVDRTSENSDNIETKIMLTNHLAADKTGNKIWAYNLKNNSSRISLSNGYKRILQMWDNLEEASSPEYGDSRLIEFDIEAFSTKKENLLDMEEPLKGRKDEDFYESQTKHKWVGRMQDYSLNGNVHLNHKYSVLNNYQNIKELEKMVLVVDLETFNPGLYRNQMVPVIIYNIEDNKVTMSRDNDALLKEKGVKSENKSFDFEDDGESDMTLDDFTSGHYVIGGIEYIYETGNPTIRQRLTLLRREWPVRANSL